MPRNIREPLRYQIEVSQDTYDGPDNKLVIPFRGGRSIPSLKDALDFMEKLVYADWALGDYKRGQANLFAVMGHDDNADYILVAQRHWGGDDY